VVGTRSDAAAPGYSGRVSGQPTLKARVDLTLAAVAGATLVGLALRVAVLVRPIGVIDRLFIPDDTYYTLTIARSIAKGHGPTVDGHTLTAGFQALLGFLMVPVYWVTDNPDTALRVDLTLLVLVDTATIVVLAWLAFRVAGRVAAITAALLWAISPVAVSMALGGLETSLAILCEIGLVAVWMWAGDRPASTRRWSVVGVVAGLAVLARIDALLLVASLALLQLWRGPRRPLVQAGIAAAVTLAPWWIWCAVNFGTPIPTSGDAAHDLAPLSPFAREGLAQLAGAVVGGPFALWHSVRDRLNDEPLLGVLVFWILVAGLLALTWWWARGRVQPQPAVAALPVFAAGLLVFYAWFGVGWYFTRYLAPVAAVATLAISVLVARVAALHGGWQLPAVGSLALLLLVGGIAAITASEHNLTATRGTASRFDSVTGYRDAAMTVVRVPPQGSTLGAWQAGAFAYYANDRITVVNLYGVVKPDAAEAARDDRTAAYIRDRGVDWLADFTLHIVWFDVAGSRQLHPQPTVGVVEEVRQYPPFPEYKVARIAWP
jgi:hypothetical protein